MRNLASLSFLLLVARTPDALAQAEATFPIPEETTDDDAEQDEATSEAPQEPAPALETPESPAAPAAADSQEADPNPYGPPPPPPGPIPGNPYGTVPHRLPTPATNPYMGGSTSVTAAETPPPETIEETSWSVGGGLAAEAPPPGYEGYRTSPWNRLRPSLLFERRLSDSLHLLFQASVAYQKSRMNFSGPANDDGTFEELGYQFEGGIRWVAKPGSPVEIGMSHVLSISNYQAISEGAPNMYLPGIGDAELDEWTIGLSNSFIAERRLIPHLWLRMGVGLVGLRYRTAKLIEYQEVEDEATGEISETNEESDSTGFHVGLTPSFALQLRLTF